MYFPLVVVLSVLMNMPDGRPAVSRLKLTQAPGYVKTQHCRADAHSTLPQAPVLRPRCSVLDPGQRLQQVCQLSGAGMKGTVVSIDLQQRVAGLTRQHAALMVQGNHAIARTADVDCLQRFELLLVEARRR